MEKLDFLLLVVPALAGLVVHELFHGLAATFLGDPTPKVQGRLSLNPLRHLDLFGTVMIFIVHFGWAKPVIVNPRYFRRPRLGMLFVALAGPFANLLLAFLFAGLARVLGPMIETHLAVALAWKSCTLGVWINLALMVFNLIPIPPLDGARLWQSLIPSNKRALSLKLERIGVLFFLGLVVLGMATKVSVFSLILSPVVQTLFHWLMG